MSTNKTNTPAHRRKLAINRVITNIRQLMDMQPTPELEALVLQHTDLLAAMYRCHVKASKAEETAEKASSDPQLASAGSEESQLVADPAGSYAVTEGEYRVADLGVPNYDDYHIDDAYPTTDADTTVKKKKRKKKTDMTETLPDYNPTCGRGFANPSHQSAMSPYDDISSLPTYHW